MMKKWRQWKKAKIENWKFFRWKRKMTDIWPNDTVRIWIHVYSNVFIAIIWRCEYVVVNWLTAFYEPAPTRVKKKFEWMQFTHNALRSTLFFWRVFQTMMMVLLATVMMMIMMTMIINFFSLLFASFILFILLMLRWVRWRFSSPRRLQTSSAVPKKLMRWLESANNAYGIMA